MQYIYRRYFTTSLGEEQKYVLHKELNLSCFCAVELRASSFTMEICFQCFLFWDYALMWVYLCLWMTADKTFLNKVKRTLQTCNNTWQTFSCPFQSIPNISLFKTFLSFIWKFFLRNFIFYLDSFVIFHIENVIAKCIFNFHDDIANWIVYRELHI